MDLCDKALQGRSKVWKYEGATKGQFISNCPFGVIVFPKYQRKDLTISALKSEKLPNQQNKGTFL